MGRGTAATRAGGTLLDEVRVPHRVARDTQADLLLLQMVIQALRYTLAFAPMTKMRAGILTTRLHHERCFGCRQLTSAASNPAEA